MMIMVTMMMMMMMVMMITMSTHLLLVWSDVIRFGAGGREGGAAIGPDSRKTCKKIV